MERGSFPSLVLHLKRHFIQDRHPAPGPSLLQLGKNSISSSNRNSSISLTRLLSSLCVKLSFPVRISTLTPSHCHKELLWREAGQYQSPTSACAQSQGSGTAQLSGSTYRGPAQGPHTVIEDRVSESARSSSGGRVERDKDRKTTELALWSLEIS